MKKILLLLFLFVAFAQWAVPLQMIWKKENTIAHGKQFKFRTAPFDPYDYMRGKYIMLNFSERLYTLKPTDSYTAGDFNFVSITEDKEGFAHIESISKDEPEGSPDYVKIHAERWWKGNKNISIDFPFDHFYMEETKASEAEKLYLEATRDTALKTYALVNIKNGDAIVTDVIIGEKSIRELLGDKKK